MKKTLFSFVLDTFYIASCVELQKLEMKAYQVKVEFSSTLCRKARWGNAVWVIGSQKADQALEIDPENTYKDPTNITFYITVTHV